jgi:hypothetical protein
MDFRSKNGWENKLQFGCTGCGNFCKNEGEVNFSTNEFVEVVNRLYMPREYKLPELEHYSEKVSSGWVKMKSVFSFIFLMAACCIVGAWIQSISQLCSTAYIFLLNQPMCDNTICSANQCTRLLI